VHQHRAPRDGERSNQGIGERQMVAGLQLGRGECGGLIHVPQHLDRERLEERVPLLSLGRRRGLER
jgi:hypothetical protein